MLVNFSLSIVLVGLRVSFWVATAFDFLRAYWRYVIYSVFVLGLPLLLSMAIGAFTAMPENLEAVRRFTPSRVHCALIACPIPFKFIMPLGCNFWCKSTIFFEIGGSCRNMLRYCAFSLAAALSGR